MVNFSGVEKAAWFAIPDPGHFSLEFNTAAIVAMRLMTLVSAVETVGDISGVTKGGAAIVMFGMIVSAGLSLLSEVKMNRRNMVIVALSLGIGIGLGLAAAPKAIGIFPAELKILLVSGLFTSALVAIVLNIFLPEED
ncbi:MAG: solute carrier family 23 protein [Alphaproteobacteria bacterium]|jgi:xanthine/uracil permease